MKKSLNFVLIFIVILVLSACSEKDKSLEEERTNTNETEVQTEEAKDDTYPLVIESVYLASDELIDDVIVLLIEATNISDEDIVVETTNFGLEKRDEDIEFIRYGAGEEEIILHPNETNVFLNYQLAPNDFHFDLFELKDFRLTYTGKYYNDHKPMRIKREIPTKYQEMVEKGISDYKNQITQIESEIIYEEPEISVKSDPVKITGYELDTDGTIYIRIENLTDEEFYFEPKYLRLYDPVYQYETDPKVYDSAIDNGVRIAPHDKLEFRQFYLLSNPSYDDKDKIVENILGLRYKTEWPMAVEYDIYGKIEGELPEDFYEDE